MDEVWLEVIEHHERFLTYALRHAAQSRDWIARQGHDVGELHPHALLNHAWTLFLEGKWNPQEKGIRDFFFHEIRNRVRNLERQARRRHLRIVGSEPVPGQEIAADELPGGDRELMNTMAQLDWQRLSSFLAGRKPALARLAEFIVQGYSCAEQAEMLCISVATRLRWQYELARLVQEYRGAVTMEAGDPTNFPIVEGD